jgi:hypothetical protein
MTTTEIAELRRSIGQLRQCLGTLRSRYGDAPAVRRLVNDVERLDIDADELEGAPPAPAREVPAQQTGGSSPSGMIPIDDTPYDESLWEGADDEGVGGYRGERR